MIKFDSCKVYIFTFDATNLKEIKKFLCDLRIKKNLFYIIKCNIIQSNTNFFLMERLEESPKKITSYLLRLYIRSADFRTLKIKNLLHSHNLYNKRIKTKLSAIGYASTISIK